MFCFSDQSINELNTDQQFTDRPQNLKKTNITFGIRTSNLDCEFSDNGLSFGHNMEGVFHGW